MVRGAENASWNRRIPVDHKAIDALHYGAALYTIMGELCGVRKIVVKKEMLQDFSLLLGFEVTSAALNCTYCVAFGSS